MRLFIYSVISHPTGPVIDHLLGYVVMEKRKAAKQHARHMFHKTFPEVRIASVMVNEVPEEHIALCATKEAA
jgi:hypothetical protein